MPLARELGIGLVPYSPLGRRAGSRAPSRRPRTSTRAAGRHPRFAGEAFEANRALAAVVREVAAELGVAPGQVALAWLLARGEDVVPIPGTR